MHPPAPTTTPPAVFNQAASWNQRFAAEGYVFGTEPNHWLQVRAGCWPAGARVLCVADGEGRNSVWLARQGLQVDAFDIAEVGVAKARQLASDAGVTVNYTVSGCDEFDWPVDHYDGVAAIFIQFADPAQRERLFARMVASLRPGGTLVLQGYTPRQLEFRTGGPPVLSHLYTPELLRTAFAGLDIVELADYEQEVNEGSGHSGMSALIGLVARRRPAGA
jgi:SAM-dependent methyltransferase